MIQVNNPLLALFVFVLFVTLGMDLLVHMNNWIRRIGKFVLWSRKSLMCRHIAGGKYYENKAHKAIDQPEQVLSYRVILLLIGIVSLGISLCSLVGLLAFLVGTSG